MSRALPVIVVASVIILVAYFVFSGGPVKAFEDFSESWARDKREEAASYCADDETARFVKERHLQKVVKFPVQTLGTSDLKVLSDEKNAAGDVVVRGRQVVYFNPPGVESALYATMFAVVEHKTTLSKTDSGWKVIAFEPECTGVKEMQR